MGALEFHHKDPSQKDFHVSTTGIHKAREEVKKCILVCSNCHMELHGGIIPIPS
jgi:predicted HNH restriction endonuclease